MNRDAVHKQRKVQQLGSSTLAVSIPADWASRHDVEKGDDMLVRQDETGGSLLLVPPDPSREDQEVTVSADELSPDTLERAIVTQYVLGRQLVHVASDEPIDPARREAVLAAERRLMGLGIVEEGTTELTVRCSVAPTDFELPTLLGRLARTERTMRSNAVGALQAGDRSEADAIEPQRRQLERLFHLFLRLVFATYRNPRLNHAVGLASGFPLVGFRSAAQDLRLMGGVAERLSDLVVEGTPPPEAAADHLSAIDDALDEASEATQSTLVAPEYEARTRARTALDAADEAVEAAQAYLEAERPEPLLELQRAIVLLERSVRHAGDSLDVATHLLFREDPHFVGDA